MSDQLAAMCASIMALKREENGIKEQRAAIENEIAAMLTTKDEGTDSAKKGIYKITVTNKLTRSLDYPAYLAIENDIPEGIRCVTMKPELDIKKLRAMEMVRPGFSAAFVTSRPAKPSVKIEVLG